MSLPDRFEFRLTLPGMPELASLLRDFVGNVLRFAEFETDVAEELTDALASAVGLIESEVERGGDGDLPITIGAVVDGAAVEFSILERGRPLGDGDEVGSEIPARIRPARVFDRVWWVQRGPEGSELHLRRVRSHENITALVGVAARLANDAHDFESRQTAPSTEQYRLRPFEARDALEVSRCIYEAYGHSYPNPDLFYPDRIIALNQAGRLRSLVAETVEGAIVGHYALERPELGPTAEAGQAVIHHAHRGRGLMQLMRKAVEDEGRRLGLLGIWSQPTARHPFSQKMNIAFGSVPCGLSLGTTPATTILRGGVESQNPETRHSCFLYWHPFDVEAPLQASVPAALAPLIAELYATRKRGVTIDTALVRPNSVERIRTVHTIFERNRNVGRIWVERIDAETLPVMREALRVLSENAGAEAIYVDLPIDDPSCAFVATELLTDGLVPGGIGPRFLQRGTHARTRCGCSCRLRRSTAMRWWRSESLVRSWPTPRWQGYPPHNLVISRPFISRGRDENTSRRGLAAFIESTTLN
ncbi:MAG: hypothetical protein QM811_19305 [Pirellulales bacterium]